jgi:ABC-2 type transport system permease protein
MFMGSVMPWVDPETIGPQVLSYYLWPFLVFALPNVFMICAILFSVATILRSMMASYIGAVILVMGYLVTQGVVGNKIEYRETFARFDPFGLGAIDDITRYWTQAEMNTRLIDLTAFLPFNRIFALALGLAFLGFTLWRFTMTERAPSKRKLRRMAKRDRRAAALAAVPAMLGGDAVTARTADASRWVQLMTRLKVETRQVLTSPGLFVLFLFAVGNTATFLWFGQTAYGTADHPTVAATIDGVRGGFAIILIMIAGFYGGELVWRERDRKLNEIIDSTPLPAWVMTVPKIAAIFLVMLIVNVGAHDFGVTDYLTWYILPASVDALLLAVLAVFFQVLSPNKYVGWGLLFVWFVGSIFLNNMGYSNPLYTYQGGPQVPLSDFVGTGSFWKGAAVFQFYWAMFALLMLVAAHLLWPRGTDLSLKLRARRARHGVFGAPLVIAGGAAVAMAATGAYAYHNIKVLNRYETRDDAELYSANYEKKYLKYENLPQPAVTNVVLNAELFPKERRLIVNGRYDLENKTAQPIRAIHLRKGDRNVEWLKLDVAGAKLAFNDEEYGYRIYRFDRPLAPGAKSAANFTSRIWHRGFPARTPDTDVIENGTFINNSAFAPVVGMDRNSLLQDRSKRRRQGLTPDLRMAKLEDKEATKRNYIGADWVTSDITLTTDAGQVPVAPGKRVSDVTNGPRRTAHFVSEAPLLNFFSLQSADYKIARERHNGLELEVYYHQGHEFNVPKMLRAMGTALDYYRKNFGPYQFEYARIIEFPRYASFAQAFAGTMPYSENIGFVADTDDPKEIDWTTYVIAHEIGHQYWAHQVVGADQQGGTLTSETLAQYSALMVMKHLYGPEKIRRFLKYELDGYLRGRQNDVIEEEPLERVENQGYIHYRKGSVVMYLLQERLGEDAVNRALQRFVAKFRFSGPPYLQSTDLIAELRKEAKTPEDQALITDLFQRITVYDLKVKDASTRKVGNEWETTLTIGAGKYYAGGKGAEKAAPLNERIEVGLFNARPGLGDFDRRNVIALAREPIRGGTQKIVIRSKTKPTFAGVDPYNYYVDRNSEDNVKDVTAA